MLLSNIEALFNVPVWWLAFICALVFLAGYVDAIAGGGGFIALPAYLIAGLPPHNAIATSKMSSAMGTCVSTWHYARAGYIDWKLAVPCVLCAIVGSTIGANLLLLVDTFFLTVFLLIVLPCTGVYVLRSKGLSAEAEREPLPRRRTVAACCAFALFVGVYDGFYGPGTGTFLMLLLNGLAHLRLGAAAGITKAINLTTNFAALATFLVNGQVLLALGFVAGCFNIAGNYIGARKFTKSQGGVARPLIMVVLAVFFVRVVYDLVVGA